MNHLDIEQPREIVVGLIGERLFDRGRALGRQTVSQRGAGDLDQSLLGEMTHETGIGPVFHDRRRAVIAAPSSELSPQRHVTGVERAFLRGLHRRVGVGLPDLHRGVQVADVVVPAPFEKVVETDVPCQVEEEIALTQLGAEGLVEIRCSDLMLLVPDTLADRRGDLRSVVAALDHRDRRWIELEVFKHEREHALHH